MYTCTFTTPIFLPTKFNWDLKIQDCHLTIQNPRYSSSCCKYGKKRIRLLDTAIASTSALELIYAMSATNRRKTYQS